jgi:putative MATE family efflux protein
MLNNRLDLGQDEIKKLFIAFVVPGIIAMVATTTAGLVDSYFIGNYIGSQGIGAITLVVPILNIFSGIAVMIVSGGVVLSGIASGKKDETRSNNIFNVTFFMLLITSLMMMVIIKFFGKGMVVNLIGIKGDLLTYILDYLMVINIFLPFFVLMFFFSFFLKLDGYPVVIVKVTIIGVLINIIMDYLLVNVFSLGMKGAAFATGISQVIPCIIFFWVAIKHSNWEFRKPEFHFSDIKEILFNGSSEFLSLGSVGIAGYIYNLTITKNLGADGIAAYGIAMQVSGIAIMVFYGISDGIASIISFNYGAQKLERVKEIRNLAFKYSGIILCACFSIYLSKEACFQG